MASPAAPPSRTLPKRSTAGSVCATAGLEPAKTSSPKARTLTALAVIRNLPAPQHAAKPRVVRGELPFTIFCKRLLHLVDLRVEVVDGRQNHRLDGHRLYRRAELLVTMVGDDQVLDLRAEKVGKARNARHCGAYHHRAERNVADEV